MADTINQEWLNKNSLRAYPLCEDSPRCPTRGNQQRISGYAVIPNYMIVDFEASTLGDISRISVAIRRIVFVGNTLSFFFNYVNGGMYNASVAVNLDTHTPNTAYRFEEVINQKTLPHQTLTGSITLGDLTNLRQDFPEGVYEYGERDCVFEPSCMHVSPVGVTAIRAVNSSTGYATRPLVGTVRLVAGQNIRFSYDNTDGNTMITIHAEDGAGPQEDGCDCGSAKKTINTINGIHPDNLVITGGDGISVDKEGSNVLRITNTSSKPCCGCAELAFVNEKISAIQTAITRLINYSQTLVQHAMEFKTIVGPADD